MEQIIFSINVVFPIFLVGALGYFLKKMNMMTEEFAEQAASLCFSAFLPVMLFLEIYKADVRAGFDSLIFAYAIGVTLLIVVGSFVLTPLLVKDATRRGTICQALFRANIMTIGFPILQNMYGEGAGTYLAPLMAPLITIYNVAAVLSFTLFSPEMKEKHLGFKDIAKRIITNQYIIAMALAGFFIVTGYKLPVFVFRTAESISKLAIPLALLTIGGQFSLGTAKDNLRYSVSVSLLRVLGIPLVTTTGAVLLGIQGEALITMVLIFGTSTAVSCAAMAQSMHGDFALAGEITLFSTLFSVFSLFLFVFALKTMGLI